MSMNTQDNGPEHPDGDELFDDLSRYLDRFGLLLALVSLTIVLSSLNREPDQEVGMHVPPLGALVFALASFALVVR
jgi:hypothetical protein